DGGDERPRELDALGHTLALANRGDRPLEHPREVQRDSIGGFGRAKLVILGLEALVEPAELRLELVGDEDLVEPALAPRHRCNRTADARETRAVPGRS